MILEMRVVGSRGRSSDGRRRRRPPATPRGYPPPWCACSLPRPRAARSPSRRRRDSGRRRQALRRPTGPVRPRWCARCARRARRRPRRRRQARRRPRPPCSAPGARNRSENRASGSRPGRSAGAGRPSTRPWCRETPRGAALDRRRSPRCRTPPQLRRRRPSPSLAVRSEAARGSPPGRHSRGRNRPERSPARASRTWPTKRGDQSARAARMHGSSGQVPSVRGNAGRQARPRAPRASWRRHALSPPPPRRRARGSLRAGCGRGRRAERTCGRLPSP